ncbi:hypothetical protein N5P37_001728 [Trichoderma harzianum]|nr:hypothetical protein N5P37_001728 [Trichoderma harzianum]
MADAEKHPIIAEKIFDLFDLFDSAFSLLATPGFEECGLPQSWFDFAETYPKVATTVKAGAKAFAIPGNKTMEEEFEKGLPSFYILNPIYQSGVSAQSPGGGRSRGHGPGYGAAGLSPAESAPEGGQRVHYRLRRRLRGSLIVETSLRAWAWALGGGGKENPSISFQPSRSDKKDQSRIASITELTFVLISTLEENRSKLYSFSRDL